MVDDYLVLICNIAPTERVAAARTHLCCRLRCYLSHDKLFDVRQNALNLIDHPKDVD